MHFSKLRILAVFFLILLMAGFARADEHARVSASFPTENLHAGDKTTLTITTAVADGFHLQSHTPSDPLLIKFEVTPTTAPSDPYNYAPVQYAPGEDKVFASGPGNVYEGTFETKIPVTIADDAKPGPLELSGMVTLQACNEDSCFGPESPVYKVSVTIVPKQQVLVAATQQATSAPVVASPPSTPTVSRRHKKSGSSTIFGIDLKKSGLAGAVPIGFVIGMIFNLMPCVLPVVPLKIMGFYEASQHNRARSFGLGVAFSLGMVGSFTALGLLIFPLHAIDWGGLFQKTWFLVTIVGVMTAMAAGTFGLFSVALPGNLYNVSPRHDTVSGNVLFGILTAALSTPCTFGVFAALLAWLISQPAWVGVVVMDAVGIGMAAPYLLLSGFPEVARRFPRTGPWSEVVKQFMAFLLLASAVFFAQPFFAKVNAINTNWWLVFAVVAAGGVFLIVRGIQLHKSPVAIWVTSILAILIVAPAGYIVRGLMIQPYQWTPYSDKAVADALAAGRPVVVDFTASWCTNCHWIELHTLPADSVVAAVRDTKAVMLKADIDHPEAAARLQSLEPSKAIPLTAVYRPGGGEPDLLDGLYSASDLVEVMTGK